MQPVCIQPITDKAVLNGSIMNRYDRLQDLRSSFLEHPTAQSSCLWPLEHYPKLYIYKEGERVYIGKISSIQFPKKKPEQKFKGCLPDRSYENQ